MKRFLKIIGTIILVLSIAILILIIFDFGYIFRGMQVTYFQGHKTAYIDDYPNFKNRKIESKATAKKWPEHSEYNSENATQELSALNEELETAAFLIIKNDSIWFEKYYQEYNAASKTNSFSMAKSIVSALLGKAIKDGHITSLEQPVSDFYPQYNSALKVGDLASMSSGLNWNENYYNPFGMTARAYFDENIRELVLRLKVTEIPGESFKYLSGNTILLGMVIEKASGMNLSEYLSESFWKPLNMQHDALWQLDSEKSGMEKAYCCIASNARDFARFGKLFKNNGKWEGKQILTNDFVKTATSPRFEESPQYGYGFWLSDYKDKDIFYMRGIRGQYVIVIPEDDLIIVRLGENLIKKEEDEKHAPDFYKYIDETYKMLNDAA
ncbi:CubicO group peptidase, beta-lactamase class C family [Salegentibacter echinorum]|uniref:CubicO group peptidase, beta-lactamase class C family n=1 Tax=Salegentibacter echinorum TaxID=1073325 RepID=A0A1M5DR79_SALEC|nr:serine hydrolase [Salegentibacter echinorum]SHF69384.1 CubicO group peptidase, beta-lactamase class C family [Salegentibacter echinorum]